MKKIYLLLLFFTTVPFYAWADDDNTSNSNHEKTTQKQPDTTPTTRSTTVQPAPRSVKTHTPQAPSWDFISLILDYGLNRLYRSPKKMTLNFLGSRVFRASAHYNIPISTSPFALSPGVGLSLETYQFKAFEKQYYTLVRNMSRNTRVDDAKQSLPNSKEIISTKLKAYYVDLLLEARFHAKPQYPKEHLFIAVGGKLGIRWKSSTNVKYSEDNIIKKRTIEDSWNLNRVRYGVYARTGWGRFGLYYNWMFSQLFIKGKGPTKDGLMSHHICVSVDLF